jgi:3-deoxy-D-manno-octulosonate 8-phosphate phosphatase (KDO 8-P phosphatase)
MEHISEEELFKLAEKIKLLVLDVDGVLTDGGIILDGGDNELKSFHVRDGHGIKMLMSAGINVAIITGRSSKVVERRGKELGISEIFQKCHDKTIAYRKLADKYFLKDSEIAYVGDDVVDIAVLRMCGFPVAVADAEDEVKASVRMITKKGGGRGAVREVCNFLLKARGLTEDIIDEHAET